MDGCKIKDSGIRAQHNTIIVAITDRAGQMHFNPDAEQVLQAGDLLIALGNRADLNKLAEIANYTRGRTGKLPNLRQADETAGMKR